MFFSFYGAEAGQEGRGRQSKTERSQYKHVFLYTGNAIKAVQKHFSLSHFIQIKTKSILKQIPNLDGVHDK